MVAAVQRIMRHKGSDVNKAETLISRAFRGAVMEGSEARILPSYARYHRRRSYNRLLWTCLICDAPLVHGCRRRSAGGFAGFRLPFGRPRWFVHGTSIYACNGTIPFGFSPEASCWPNALRT